MPHAKAQISSMDIILSVLILMLFFGIVLTLAATSKKSTEVYVVYGGEIFRNIENMPLSFLTDYHVDEARLNTFKNTLLPEEREELILLETSTFSKDLNDVCIFFTESGTVQPIDGVDALGEVKDSPGKKPCPTVEPCEDYKKSIAHIMPVERQGKIMKLHVVVCE